MQRNSQGGVARLDARQGGGHAGALETRRMRRRIGDGPGPARADLPASLRELLAALDWNRLLDIAIATVALVVLSPLIALVAFAVKLDSHGPVFFRCSRVGRGGRPLTMLKFRKMRNGVSSSPLTAARMTGRRLPSAAWASRSV